MSDLTTLSNDALLAELERKGRALERFEMADGQAWYQERQERERTKREYTALCAEWTRRNTSTEPRFAMTYCSQCGKELGPGDSGVSHCHQHGA